jgi:hypothetical protein
MDKGSDTLVVALVLLICAGAGSTPAVAASGGGRGVWDMLPPQPRTDGSYAPELG